MPTHLESTSRLSAPPTLAEGAWLVLRKVSVVSTLSQFSFTRTLIRMADKPNAKGSEHWARKLAAPLQLHLTYACSRVPN